MLLTGAGRRRRVQVAAHHVINAHRWAAFVVWPWLLDAAATVQGAAQAHPPPPFT